MSVWLTHRMVQAFAAVMSAGSVSKAADQLHISQPAVSRLIKDLEANLGFSLFNRIRGRMVPTEDAVDFYADVERSFTGLDALARSARQIAAGRKRQSISIASIPSVSLAALPGALNKAFGDSEIAIDLTSGSSSEVLRRILSRQAEIGIIAPVASPVDIQVLGQINVPFYVIASAEFSGRLDDLPSLSGETLIEFSLHSHTRALVEMIIKAEGLDFRSRLTTDLSSMVSSLVLAGLGVAIVDGFTAKLHQKAGGQAVQLDPTHCFSVQIVTRVSLILHEAGRKVVAALLDDWMGSALPAQSSP